jgi:hypothetical protein
MNTTIFKQDGDHVLALTILSKRSLFLSIVFNNSNDSIASPAIRIVVDKLVTFLKVALLLLELLLLLKQ